MSPDRSNSELGTSELGTSQLSATELSTSQLSTSQLSTSQLSATELSATDRVILGRRMVREYTDEPVPENLVTELLDLAVHAPSAGFTQGVTFQVLTGADLSRFWEITTDGSNRWLERISTAPVLVLVWTSKDAYFRRYTEQDKGWDAEDQPWTAPYWYVDAGMAAQNILLGAVDRGLGACFFGVPMDRVDAVREGFGVPVEQLSVGVVSLGWIPRTEQASGSAKTRRRRNRTDQVHRGQW